MKRLTRDEAQTVKTQAVLRWISADGGMKLEPNEEREPFPGHTERTAANDNPILFLVLFYYLLREHDLFNDRDKERFVKYVEACRVPGKPGHFHRNPGRFDRDEAHDNYKAIAAGDVICGGGFAAEIVSAGEKIGYIFENVEPQYAQDEHKWLIKWFGMDLSRWRQGSDIAAYKMCAGFMPTGWEWLWLMVAVLSQCFTGVRHTDKPIDSMEGWKNTDNHFLTWITTNAIAIKYTEMDAASEKVPFKFRWMYVGVMTAAIIWKIALYCKSSGRGIEGIMLGYFRGIAGEPHPNVSLSRGISI